MFCVERDVGAFGGDYEVVTEEDVVFGVGVEFAGDLC